MPTGYWKRYGLPHRRKTRMSEIFWSVDSLVIRDNVLFGFGWIFHAKHEIKSLQLRISQIDGDTIFTEHIPADAGKPRRDVECAFPNQAGALNSGFVVFGAFTTKALLDSIQLVYFLEDGSRGKLAIAAANITHFSRKNESGRTRLMLRHFSILLRRAIRLLLDKKPGILWEKLRRYQQGKPKIALKEGRELDAVLTAEECKDWCLIVDHDLGGGANQYRKRLVDAIVHEGRGVIILTYHVANLSHMLIVSTSKSEIRYSIPDKKIILEITKNIELSEIIYNTAVSFSNPEEIPQLLISLKQRKSAQLKILVHDFYLVCPSHFLIDNEDKHCRIPSTNVCSGCLKKNQQGFSSLFVERDIRQWRSLWGTLLATADEIIAFSNSSAQTLLRAYPQIEGCKLSIIPHQVEHLTGNIPEIKNIQRLCLGVVGHIGFHKGARFVQALAQEIRQRKMDCQIVVIGAIEANCDSAVVSQTGPYRHQELPGLIEKSGVNIMLFPSICPETFSYVVQELMDMHLPVAAFNLGAPAERLLSYTKGLVLNSMEPGAVLDELIEFHQKTYLTH